MFAPMGLGTSLVVPSPGLHRAGTVWCMSRLDRIASDPAVGHGQPTIRGLRYPVETFLELLSSGMTIEEILGDYPDLEREDVLAALELRSPPAGAGRSRSAPREVPRRCAAAAASGSAPGSDWARCDPHDQPGR
jgi:uncharacterized protein (DUF433 family)